MDDKPSPTASIYKRLNIRWLPGPFEEPTSTLVIGSPSGLFVDLRIDLKEPYLIDGTTGLAASTSSSTTTTNTANVGRLIGFSGTSIEDPTSFSRLSFAVGGQAHYGNDPDGKRRGIWKHWVTYIPSPFKSDQEDMTMEDTGTMEELDDGSTREDGEMVNPETGKVTAYQETWADVMMVEKAPGWKGVRKPSSLIGAGSAGEAVRVNEKRIKGSYVVTRTETDNAKGMIVWAGQACQGILRYKDKTGRMNVVAERWEAGSVADQGDFKWTRVFRHGEGVLPCGLLLEEAEESLKEGHKLNVPVLNEEHREGADGWVVIETDFVYNT
jgi:hypothetical protein